MGNAKPPLCKGRGTALAVEGLPLRFRGTKDQRYNPPVGLFGRQPPLHKGAMRRFPFTQGGHVDVVPLHKGAMTLYCFGIANKVITDRTERRRYVTNTANMAHGTAT